MSDGVAEQVKKFVFKSRISRSGENDIESLEILIPEASYSFYTWPSAPVLAWFLWEHRRELAGKHILELGSGTALPGILAAKCGAAVTLTDSASLPRSLQHVQRCCEVNGLLPSQVRSITMAEAEYEASDLTDTFVKAADHLKTIIKKVETSQLLEFYAFYKQAVEGPCNIPKPGWYEMQAKQKWQAWQSLGEMPREAAMKNYVRLISEIDPDWEDSNSTSDGSESGGGKTGWVAVSCLSNTDEYLDDRDKTIFDWVKEGNVDKINEFAKKSALTDTNIIDSQGMGLIHWAADRGNLPTLKCLVQDLTADIDLKDGDGQTALHYAASCGHVEIVRYLLDNGANPNVADSDGMLPVDVASGSEIVESLKAS
ncbi:hypothetical protein C0J52_19462 [Blattella germanica]|nr:hypothetical protein C0J52_19462 [Blattella germanica]